MKSSLADNIFAMIDNFCIIDKLSLSSFNAKKIVRLDLFEWNVDWENSYIFFDKMIHKVLRRGKKCLHPYLIESTSSRLITEVKQSWAWLVLGWVTAWEYQVL